jgi:hypothetical protein
MQPPSPARTSAPQVIGIALLWACSSQEPTVSIRLAQDDANDTWTRSPAPSVLVLSATSASATTGALTTRELYRAALTPRVSIIDLGSFARDEGLRLSLSGLLPSGAEAVTGATPGFVPRESADRVLFTQRTGEFARLPFRGLNAAPNIATEVLSERYLLTAAEQELRVLDFSSYLPVATVTSTSASFAVRSVIANEATVVLVGDQKSEARSARSLAVLSSLSEQLPASLSRAAGARALHHLGETFLVESSGARSEPSSAYWYFTATADLPEPRSLLAAHRNAVAAYASGLFVISEGVAPELAKDGKSVLLGYPVTDKAPLAASSTDETHVLVVFGDGAVQRYDVTCTSNCTPERWANIGFDGPSLAHTRAPVSVQVSASGSSALVLFDDGARNVTAKEALIVPLREAHIGGTLVQLPTGGVGVVGGSARIERWAFPATP